MTILHTEYILILSLNFNERSDIVSEHRNTKQKSVILEFLKHNPTQITAEDLIFLLHSSGEKVGRATVYRFLREMEACGKVKKYTLGEKAGAYYQYVGDDNACNSHYHLMCTLCGKLEHLDSSVAEAFSKSARENYGFEIDCGRTVFYGKCKNCKEVHS